jgi:pimeloyl-ACP methyl ester carboxylesterase
MKPMKLFQQRSATLYGLGCLFLAVGGLMAQSGAGKAKTRPGAIVRRPVVKREMKDGYVEVGGARLYYVDTGGSGQPVVFLHAATGSTDAWENQVRAVVGAGYRFIAFDRRGWGKTVVEPGGPVGTAPDDLLALVDKLGIDKFHLVATAGGGFVALDFAVSYQQRLRSLVIANSIMQVQDADYQALLARIRPAQFNALPEDFKELGPSYRAANPDGVARWLALEKAARPNGAPMAQPTKNRVTFALVEQLWVPILFLAGGADLFAPPPVMRQVAAHVKGSEFRVFPEVGHSTAWEAPDEFNAAVLGFLAQHRR